MESSVSAIETVGHALVIERDATIRDLLRSLLMLHLHCDVTDVDTIVAGVEQLKAKTFAIVIVDISTSAAGIELLTQETRKQSSTVLVLTTGRIDRAALELFVSDHVFAVFPKPFDPGEVVTALRQGLVEMKQPGADVIVASLHRDVQTFIDKREGN